MTRTFIITLLFAASVAAPAVALAAQSQDSRPMQPGKALNSVTIPKDAVANADGTWSWTDKQGKHWTYKNTPFGVSRVASQDAADSVTNARLPAGVPKGAIRKADGNYAWTDASGKKWIFAVTPFGLSRTPAASAPDWKVTDKGDTVRFERSGGPMGPSVWEKKKTELNDEERSAYESQKAVSQ